MAGARSDALPVVSGQWRHRDLGGAPGPVLVDLRIVGDLVEI
ncbi:hypothetical protein [Streptomyces sp. NPDC003697]